MDKDALQELGTKERHLAFLEYRLGRVREMTRVVLPGKQRSETLS